MKPSDSAIFRKLFNFRQFVFVLSFVLLVTVGTVEADTTFTAVLDQAQEVPPTGSTATGSGSVILNSAETHIVVTLSFSGLSSSQTAAHIHGFAERGANAGVIIGLPNGNFTQTFAVTPDIVAGLKAGLWYFNVHSANFAGGEIRGQIEPLCTPAPLSLVGWYRAEDNANDSSGLGNNGSQQNGAGFSNGKVGRNFLLDGVNDYIDLPDVPNNSPTTAVSLQAWIKPHSIGTSQAIISNLNASNDNGTYHFVLRDDGSLQLYLQQSTTIFRQAITSPGLITANVYTHVAATFDTATQSIKIYVNGVDRPTTITGSTLTSLFDVATHPRIGAYTITGSFAAPFNGEIDEAQIYNRALSANEIQNDFNAGSAGVCTSGAYTAANLNAKIVFQSARDGDNDIFTMNADGTGVTNLNNNSSSETEPHVSPDGTKIVFAGNYAGRYDIWKVNADGSNSQNLTNLTGTNDAHAPFFSPDGTKIIFTSNLSLGATGLWRINADGTGLSEVISYNGFNILEPSYSPDGSQIAFSTNKDGNYEIYTINADGSGAMRRTTDSSTDSHVRWSPDGTKLLFWSNRDGTPQVFVMNADGSSQTQLTFGTAVNDTADWSPDGTQIVFRSNRDGNTEIYTMKSDGSVQIRRTFDGAADDNPCWKNIFTNSNANGKIAFHSSRTGNQEIFTMNADGSGQTNVSNNSANDFLGEFSPDGSKIVFTSFRNSNAEIYSMNADGSNQTRLTTNAATDDTPSWSPDGSRIVFVSTRDGNGEIYIMNADGTNQIRLTNSSGDDLFPKFSPDGSRIAFASNRTGNWEIFVMNSDGTNLVNLTNNSAFDYEPSRSPDGSKIAFRSTRSSNHEIWVMNANGTNPVNLSNNAADDFAPTFSPDGSKIAFTSFRNSNNDIYVMNAADGSNQTRLTTDGSADEYPSWQSAGGGVSPVSNLNVTFSVVSQAGNTVATPLTQAQMPALPMGYTLLGNSPIYDIRTSAAYSGNVTVTFNVSNVADAVTCNRLRSLHFENGGWTANTNATPSYNAGTQVCTVVQTVTSLSPFVVAQGAAPTGASVTVGGRVMTADGRGLRNARVTMTNMSGNTRTAMTTAFGYYHFTDVPVGESYVFSVTSRKFSFGQQLRNIVEETMDINFTADSP